MLGVILMSGRYIYDEQGNPREEADLMKWAKWFEKADRIVAKTMVGVIEVSTVFLGLDHSFGGTVPILFETMVFGGPLDGEQERYATKEQAQKGHEDWVRKAGRRMMVQDAQG